VNDETPKGTASGIRQLRSIESVCRTVFIVNDDPAARRAIAAGARALLAAVDEQTTGILILDLTLIDIPGLMLQGELKKRGIGLKSIFISDSGTIDTCVQAIKGGAIDFIEKPFSDMQLLNSVNEALAEAIADEKKRRERSVLEKRCERLTRREREVMNLLIRGETNRKLAERMGLSSRTVEIHRSKIMRKLEAASLPDLVRMVYTNGDFQPEDVLVNITQSLRLAKNQAG